MADQPPIIVEVEGVGEVEFPAGTTPAQIKSALLNARKTVKKDTGTTDDAASWASTLAKGYVNLQIGAAKGIGQTAVGAGRLIQLIPGVTAGVDALYGQPGLSARAMDEADKLLTPSNTMQTVGKAGEQIVEAIGTGSPIRKAGAYAVTKAAPYVGKLVPKIVTEAATGGLHAYLQGGDPTGGAIVAGSVPAVAQGARAGRNALFAGKANPVIQDAIDFAARPGIDIPVDAATATQRPIVQTLQKTATDSLGGAGIADRFKEGQTAALQRVGKKLAGEAHPSAVSPQMAGEGVQQTVEGVITAEKAAQNRHYGRLRQIEADPANVQRVQVGTRTLADGTVEAVMDDVQMPVDMRPAKDALRPVLEHIEQTWPVTKKDASEGLVALRNLVNGADAVPASIADMNLGALKSIVREAESPALRNRSQGLAAMAIPELEAAVQDASTKAGPDAVTALRAGRDATIRKYSAAEVLDKLREEPVQLFDSLIFKEDGGIKKLREVARLAPTEMPKVGRAYLERALTKATAEGDFDHAQRMLTQWENLGPETKAILFPNPLHRKDLDHFFLIAKKIAENPNPSGTARQLTAMNAMWLLPANALARIFYSPAGVRQLTKAVSTGNTSAVTETLGRVAAQQARGAK